MLYFKSLDVNKSAFYHDIGQMNNRKETEF